MRLNDQSKDNFLGLRQPVAAFQGGIDARSKSGDTSPHSEEKPLPASNRQRSSVTTNLGWRVGYLIAAAGIYLVDQTSKAWAVKRLRFGADKTIVKGFFDL